MWWSEFTYTRIISFCSPCVRLWEGYMHARTRTHTWTHGNTHRKKRKEKTHSHARTCTHVTNTTTTTTITTTKQQPETHTHIHTCNIKHWNKKHKFWCLHLSVFENDTTSKSPSTRTTHTRPTAFPVYESGPAACASFKNRPVQCTSKWCHASAAAWGRQPALSTMRARSKPRLPASGTSSWPSSSTSTTKRIWRDWSSCFWVSLHCL